MTKIRRTRIKKWFKFYYSILIISLVLISGTLLILIFGDSINNLLIALQFIVLITPYFILFIHFLEEKKKNNLRLKAIISQIEFIIYFIYGHHELATNVVFSEARKEIIRFRNDLSSLIANLRVYDINDLLKLNCKFTDMMNLSFFLDKYNISIAGIIDLNSPEQEKITDNKERLDKIVKELKDKL